MKLIVTAMLVLAAAAFVAAAFLGAVPAAARLNNVGLAFLAAALLIGGL